MESDRKEDGEKSPYKDHLTSPDCEQEAGWRKEEGDRGRGMGHGRGGRSLDWDTCTFLWTPKNITYLLLAAILPCLPFSLSPLGSPHEYKSSLLGRNGP